MQTLPHSKAQSQPNVVVSSLEELLEAASSRTWIQATIVTAVTRGQRKLPFMPLYVEKFLGSSWVQQLTDRQFRGYTVFLQRSWDSDTPAFLPNRPANLWRSLLYLGYEAFSEDWSVLSERIEITKDGLYIFNRKILQCYAEQLPKYLGRQERGRRGAESRWGTQRSKGESDSTSISGSNGTSIPCGNANGNGTSNGNHNHIQNHKGIESSGLKSVIREEEKSCVSAVAESAPTDPERAFYIEDLHAYWTHKNPNFKFSLGPRGAGAKNFDTWRKEHPEITREQFRECLTNRANSPINQAAAVYSWIGRVHEYLQGPLDRYWQPCGKSTKTGSHNDNKSETVIRNIGTALERRRARRAAGPEAGDTTGCISKSTPNSHSKLSVPIRA